MDQCEDCHEGKRCFLWSKLEGNKKYECYCANKNGRRDKVCYSFEKDSNINGGVVCRRETVLYEY